MQRLTLLLPVFLGYFLLSFLQLDLLVRERPDGGPFFLYGRDTVTHDAIVQIYFQRWLEQAPTTIPLWTTNLHSGGPTLGTLLITPFHPSHWFFALFSFPWAQKLALMLALSAAALGGFLWARTARLSFLPALFCGLICGFSGHLVTLIHAGHFLKIMALAAVPFVMSAVELILRGQGPEVGMRIVPLALAVALLGTAGHPQIAYMTLLLVAIRLALEWRGIHRWLLPIGGGFLIGGLLAAPTLLAVVEFAPHSNRARGVSFTEATLTSYPPAEVLEFMIPRHAGSSVRGDIYTGAWGERIVSDHVGLPVLLLAIFALIFRNRRREKILFLGAAIFFLLIGFGRFFPLYQFFFHFLPGFSSFRSPGTFMAGTTFSLAILAAYGAQDLADYLRDKKSGKLAVIFLLGIFFTQTPLLLLTNRHFLFALGWERYQVEFLAPSALDDHLRREGIGDGVHDEVSPLSLRPILFGRQARNGYHPVFFSVKEQADQRLGFQTPEWYELHGVTHLLIPASAEVPKEFADRLRRFPERALLQYDERRPMERTRLPSGFLFPEGAGRETAQPGLIVFGDWFVNGEQIRFPEARFLTRDDIPEAKEFLYRPTSYRTGLWLATLGLLAVGFLGGLAINPQRARSLSEPLSRPPQ